MSLTCAAAQVSDGVRWSVQCQRDGLMFLVHTATTTRDYAISVVCTQETRWKSVVRGISRNHVVYMIYAPPDCQGQGSCFCCGLMTAESQLT